MSEKTTFDEDIVIRGRMDIEDIVRLQINRCNASAYEPDQTLFHSSVKVLLDLLPKHKRELVVSQELEYTETDKITRYSKYWCGIPLTSSKMIVEIDIIDFHKLYRMVLDAFADSGLTWQIEPELVEMGKAKKKRSIPTPYYPEELKNDK